MDPVAALLAFGGSARANQLRGHVSRRRLALAVSAGSVTKTGKAYSVPEPDESLVRARALHGVRSHRSAARHHGFALPPGDDRHDVMIPPKAKRTSVPSDTRLHWGALSEAERERGVTTELSTVVHCLRDLPTRDALAIGDSALRSGKVEHRDLAEAIGNLRGPGSAVARRRFGQLDARAANAFESSMRALLIEAGITGFEPQVTIRHRGCWVGRVDLAHRGLRIVIECDGFETHGTRAAMVADCRRHTLFTAAGWRSLRFTWEQVMFDPDWVLQCVTDTIAEAVRAQKTTQGRLRALARAS